jgi:hypothetical protein
LESHQELDPNVIFVF